MAPLLIAMGSALAQDVPDRPRPAPVPEAQPPMDPPVEPTPVGPDPDAARQAEFHATLDVIAETARREAALDLARRVAPFELDWGPR